MCFNKNISGNELSECVTRILENEIFFIHVNDGRNCVNKKEQISVKSSCYNHQEEHSENCS